MATEGGFGYTKETHVVIHRNFVLNDGRPPLPSTSTNKSGKDLLQ